MTRSSSPASLADGYEDMAFNYTSPTRPVTPAVGTRRTRDDAGFNTDDDDDDDAHRASRPRVPAFTCVNANDFAVLDRYATQRKLKPEGKSQLKDFLALSLDAKLGMIFIDGLATQQSNSDAAKVDSSFTPSKNLITNIRSASYVALLSPSAIIFKGDVVTDTIAKKLAQTGYELPSDIMQNSAKWAILQRKTSNELSDARSQIKKDILRSFGLVQERGKTAPTAPNSNPERHLGILEYAQNLARQLPADFKISFEFCTRAAFLRKVFLAHQADDFWFAVEKELTAMRVAAKKTMDKIADKNMPDANDPKNEAEVVARFFKTFLHDDRKKYGVKDTTKDGIDDLPMASLE
ncbi:hypothetical protein MKEN_01298700 [Mycena kentingensis (nom. inval.)]|nr:hypothetical protein MKEN_01298700 [Mycena kentingensis (nom. inval.)]